MAQFPNTTDLNVLAAAMNEYAQAQGEFGGHTITLRPEDVTLSSGGSLTDSGGDVFTLQPMTGAFADSPLADVYKNGVLQESGQTLGGGYWDAIRLVGGTVLGENGKGIGWFGPDRAGADDPGQGDNAGSAVVTPEPLVVTPTAQDPPQTQDVPPPVAADANLPAAPADTGSIPSDVVHAFFHRAQHHHEHKMNFVSKATADTTASASASNVVNASVVADTAAAAVADICATTGVVAAADVASHASNWNTVDTSTLTQTQSGADCTPPPRHEQIVAAV